MKHFPLLQPEHSPSIDQAHLHSIAAKQMRHQNTRDIKKEKQDHYIVLDSKKLKHIEAERKKFLTDVMQETTDIHVMRCPRCSRHLEEKNINDTSISICDQCRGMWVDSESLAKILRLSDDVLDSFMDCIKK